MNYKIKRYDNLYKEVFISKELYEILNNNPDAVKLPLIDLNICFKDKNDIFTLFKGKNCSYCIILDYNINECFVFFIINFVIQKNIKISSAFQLLNIGKQLELNIDQFNRLFIHFNLPVYKKGLDYFDSYNKMSKLLKQKIEDKKVSLKESVLFNNYFVDNYDVFLKMIPDNLTFSEINELLKNVTENSKKDNKTIKDIINEFKVIKKNNYILYSKSLRNPLFYKYKDKLDDFIDDINLPSQARIEADEKFENQNYKMTINFSDIDSLEKLSDSIKNAVEEYKKSGKKDFFKHKNLFEE